MNARASAVSIDQIAEAYRETGSIWKVAAMLGISGQTVATRMKQAGISVNKKWITDEERGIIRAYYMNTHAVDFDLPALARSLGRRKSTICRTAGEMGLSDLRRKDNAAENKLRRQPRWQDKPHPRGMAGKTHSPETKVVIGEMGRRRWATDKAFGIGQMSPEAKAKRRQTASLRNSKIPADRRFSRTKGEHRADLGGMYFRSSWEANYARYLNLLQKMGIVTSWEFEPHTFWFEGVRRGAVSYLPDFVVFYKNDPRPEYVEIKGWEVAKDRTKWRRMAKYHPEVRLVIIREKEYRSLTAKWASSIPNWEHGKVHPRAVRRFHLTTQNDRSDKVQGARLIVEKWVPQP